jgi:hypothetical protein
MQWVIGLIAVTVVPLWMILWWIPRCNAIGVRKARDRTAREGESLALLGEAASSLVRSQVDITPAQHGALA